MVMSRWLAACSPSVREGLADAVSKALGENEQLELDFFDSAESLRRQVRMEPGALVAVGTLGPGDVSDVNLAAALIHDGDVRRVMLVREHVSGSLMSRARQAGVDLVAEVRAEGTFLYPFNRTVDTGGDLSNQEEEESAALTPEPPAPVPLSRKQRTLEEGRAPIVVVASGRGGVGRPHLSLSPAFRPMHGVCGLPSSISILPKGTCGLCSVRGARVSFPLTGRSFPTSMLSSPKHSAESRGCSSWVRASIPRIPMSWPRS